jgi:hypothetical protein
MKIDFNLLPAYLLKVFIVLLIYQINKEALFLISLFLLYYVRYLLFNISKTVFEHN